MNHEFHSRVASWVQSSNSNELASCSITELGFLRVLAQAPAYGFTVAQARTLLLRLKESRMSRLTFIPDEHDVSKLPNWVRAPKQITDGHLSKLASANGAVLATLDESIPGSYLIPAR
jgi:predicted nucleic acid-binding protein